MCRKSRSETFDRTKVGVYHAFNRTVRRSFLHGVDPLTGIDYSYRRTRFLERMQEITPFLCVEVLSFAIMENHWHCVLRNRPDKVRALSDREVAIRWLSVTSRKRCQHKQGGKIRESEIKQIVNDPERVAELRSRLSDISWFVRLLCQTIARECNIEDECTGRFFEERFKLNRLEDEADVLACMAYVDLNPLRAGLTDTLDGYAEVSIGERMRTLAEELPDTSQWLAPVEHPQETACASTEHATGEVSDASNASDASETKRAAETPPNLGCVSMTLAAYTSLLWHLALESRPELQGRVDLSREQLQKPVSKDGTAVNLAELEERHRQYARRCSSQLGQHACRAIRERLDAGRTSPAGSPMAAGRDA